MSEIEFNPKRWCMKMSKYHVRREEYDIASTFRSVAETLDSLKDANAALLTRHTALVEAVAWERECDECGEWLHRAWWDRNELNLGEIEDLYDCARAEVDRLIAEEGAK